MRTQMPVITSAYARLAGHQSEATVDTITRVTSNEVEYNRQLKFFRKEMLITMGHLNREQNLMRKSRMRYCRKLRQIKHERKKREKEERGQQRKDNVAIISVDVLLSDTSGPETSEKAKTETNEILLNPADIDCENNYTKTTGAVMQSLEVLDDSGTDTDKSTEQPDTANNGKENDTISVHRIQNDDLSQLFKKKQNKQVIVELTLPKLESPLYAIDEDSEQERKDNSNGNANGDYLGERVKSRSELLIEPVFGASSGKKRKKKTNVSYSDIIKLQHKSSSRRLFDFVDILARKHGVELPKLQVPDTRDTVVLRGSKDSLNLDPFARAGFILYPMKYGYMSDDKDNQLPPQCAESETRMRSRDGTHLKGFSPDSRQSLESNFRIQHLENGTTPSVSFEQSNLSLNKVIRKPMAMPYLSNEVSRIKRDRSNRLTEFEYSRHDKAARKQLMSLMGELPPVRHSNITSVYKRQAEETMVPWSRAIGLLKGVHSLGDANF